MKSESFALDPMENGVIVQSAPEDNGFAASVPLRSDSGATVGSLSVFDPRPRLDLSLAHKAMLNDFAQICVELLTPKPRQDDNSGIEPFFQRILQESVAKDGAIESDALLPAIIAHLPTALSIKDAITRKYIFVNPAFEHLVNKSSGEIVGRTIRDLYPEDGKKHDYRDSCASDSKSCLTVESAGTCVEGVVTQLRTKRIFIEGSDPDRNYILSLTEDVTAARKAEAAAYIDSLTGVASRAHFIDRMERLAQSNIEFTLLNVELYRFKAINDQFGMRLGDKALVQAAERIFSCMGPADLVGRIGGNEFAVLLLNDSPSDRAPRVARIIAESLAAPYLVGHRTVHGSGCIGISSFPQDAGSIDELRRRADLALRRAKQSGRGTICSFSADMDAAAQDRSILEEDLRHGLRADQIFVTYQPVLSVETGQITSVEALARWTHPVRGPISPEVFVPLAEESGLIEELGEYVLRRACADAMTWPASLRVAVNLSPLQFEKGDLCEIVSRVLDESGLVADRLQLEVTEGLLIREVDRTFMQLEHLRGLGIKVLMDDFGVGYCSLSYFQRFRFDKVKIDKSFIDGIGKSEAATAIIRSVIGLGQQLGMGIVAEGVETLEQVEFLSAAGCTHLQGYIFSGPIGADTISSMMMHNDSKYTGLRQAA